MTSETLLDVTGIAKTFPNGTVALRGVGLSVKRGEVLGLLGANGAGKSTLIKILSGAIAASGGTVTWKGRDTTIVGPKGARDLGIATIHQHIPVVPTLSVLENVFLADDGWWRHRPAHRVAYHTLCQRLNYELNPDALVADLSIGARQMVAIMAALVSGADLIIMDEPTASLANEERELVYRVVQQLSRQENKAILFVSHFLDEIIHLTDRVSVLRDGLVVLEADTADVDEAGIAEAIVGREVVAMERAAQDRQFADAGRSDTPLLELRDLRVPGRVGPISLALHAGQVIGIAGLLGSGRSELLHAIFGAEPAATGDVLVAGATLRRSTGAAVAAGLALVPEDRMRQGLVPEFEIWRNVTLPDLGRISRAGLLPRTETEVALGTDAVRRFRIKADSAHALVTELSGGNAQKVTIAKWMFGDAKVFLLDEPTAGIDIGAKTDILKLVRALAAEGKAVIIVSSEFEELIAVSDTIMVLRDGTKIAELSAGETSEHALVLLAGGGSAEPRTTRRQTVAEEA